MANFPCRQFFLISGFIHSKYDSTQNSFKISKVLLLYGIVVTITIQSYNYFQIFVELGSLAESLYSGSRHESMGKLVLSLDNVFWMIINCIHPVTIIVHQDKIVRYMNDFMEYEKNLSCFDRTSHNIDKKIRNRIMIFLSLFFVSLPSCFVPAISISVPLVLLAYTIAFDFIIGQLFECIFLQRVRYHFLFLRASFFVSHDGHGKLYEWLSLEMQLMKLAKLCERIFAKSKVVFLLGANVLISVYWFFNYDINVNIFGSLLWQSVVSSIFMLCHVWDKMASEVST